MTTYTPAQLALIEKHRNWNVDDSFWHECVTSEFKEDCADFGIPVSRTGFSGFWSQGDGAHFTTDTFSAAEVMRKGAESLATPDYANPDEFTGYRKALYDFYLMFATPLEPVMLTSPEGREFCESACMQVEKNGWYEHSGGMRLSDDSVSGIDPDLEGYAAFVDAAPTDEEIIEALRAIANELYAALEAEHEYLTSDDAVWESLQANDIDVEPEDDEDGEEVRDAA